MIEIRSPIAGPRIVINKIDARDLDALYGLEIDEAVKRYVGRPVKRTNKIGLRE